MIKLEVAEYCHDCPGFKADVDVNDYGYRVGDEYCLNTTTVIRCTYAKNCQAIFNHFKKMYDIKPKRIRIEEKE